MDATAQDETAQDETIYLFGQSAASVELLRTLARRGVPVAGFLDNNEAKHGTTQDGIPIQPVERVLDGDAEHAVVIIASRHHAAMSAQLRQLGFTGTIRVVEDSGSQEGADPAQLQRLRQLDLGEHLVLCPYNALGDVYWAMAFLPAYRKARGLDDVVVAVTGMGCREVARMFGVEPVATLTQPQMDVALAELRDDPRVLLAHHDRQHPGHAVPELSERLVRFIDQYRLVYGLSDQAVPARPTALVPWTDPDMPAGRSVIIAPYAKSVLPLPTSFWAEVVAEQRARGRAVFTNVTGDEQPLPGTVGLRVPLAAMASAVERAGAFIGLRSGLCDVIHEAHAEKTVVYPDALYSSTSHPVAEFFALPGWRSVVAS